MELPITAPIGVPPLKRPAFTLPRLGNFLSWLFKEPPMTDEERAERQAFSL
jgi:hypothetical protein